uniref:Uncharacterized protein n=1 Tax=Magnetococcus massalia (strain MO-1) TaxID=451514 RepID=A0A1S7LCF4_MAGMO|nr:protein of unknown function[Include Tubulin-tyrosine ligase domain] [Candidatus Magnetococcus massalia]
MAFFLIDGTDPTDFTRIWQEALTPAGWRVGKPDRWDLDLSVDLPDIDYYLDLADGQVVNHFPGVEAIGTKDLLHLSLQDARQRLTPEQAERLLGFTPKTYLLPDDWEAYQQAVTAELKALWLRKPRASSCGDGIELLQDPLALEPEEGWLVQRYIDNPHLINGHKYTLRFYLLISSLEPLVAYLYGDGFCKLTSKPYSLEGDALSDRLVHLTNPDLQHEAGIDASQENTRHSAYRQRLQQEGVDDAALWQQIESLLTATVLACREPILAESRYLKHDPSHTFELLGADILVDENLKPWLLECNISPSLSIESSGNEKAAEEAELKQALVKESFTLLGLLGGSKPQGPRPDDGIGRVPALQRVIAEQGRAGGFKRIYPSTNGHALAPLMPVVRPGDWQLQQQLGLGSALPEQRFYPAQGVSSSAIEDGLVLYLEQEQLFYVLNTTSGYLWLGMLEGVPVQQLAAELAEGMGLPEPPLADLLSNLADWYGDGLIMPHPTEQEVAPSEVEGAEQLLGVFYDAAFQFDDEGVELFVLGQSILEMDDYGQELEYRGLMFSDEDGIALYLVDEGEQAPRLMVGYGDQLLTMSGLVFLSDRDEEERPEMEVGLGETLQRLSHGLFQPDEELSPAAAHQMIASLQGLSLQQVSLESLEDG